MCFGYVNQIETDSPRVKNIALKQYFCLAYFVMMLVKISDQLKLESMERSLFTDMDAHRISAIIKPLKPISKSRSVTPTSTHSRNKGYLKETISTSIRKLLAKSQCDTRALSR